MHNHHRKSRKRLPFFLLFFIVMLLLLSAVVMLLWNAILPPLFGVHPVSYLQALGLLVLCRLLFGGFRFGQPSYQRFGPSGYLREKWMRMSEEEQARFRNEWQKRCGKKDTPGAGAASPDGQTAA